MSRTAASFLRGTGVGVRAGAVVLVLIGAVLAGVGWLYVLRGLGWFTAGPDVPDALPLLQLAGSDAQPLARVLVAWLTTGAVAGVAIRWIPRMWRATIAGATGAVLLFVFSQASYAVARNDRLSDVLFSRRPGLGPWLEALLLAAGCALPATSADRRLRRDRRQLLPFGLGAGEHRNASEHRRHGE